MSPSVRVRQRDGRFVYVDETSVGLNCSSVEKTKEGRRRMGGGLDYDTNGQCRPDPPLRDTEGTKTKHTQNSTSGFL